jgi:F-type H+-transporting ATPase subunit b
MAAALAAVVLAAPAIVAAQEPAPADAPVHAAPAASQPPAAPAHEPAAGDAAPSQAPQAAPADAAHAPAAGHEAAAGEHGESGAHDESVWPMVGKLVNFAILLGTVVYFARAPLASYLAGRRAQVRSDLVAADEMKKTAAAQIVEMDAKLKALPAELEALKARGQQEIAAEEKRIRELAEVERVRLLDQASREIDQRVRVAHRELVEHAAALSVDLARTKISEQITDADQARLVDRYLAEVKSHE